MDVTVNLTKKPGQSLGIGFKKLSRPPHCQIIKMLENGVAEKSGLLHKGDLLLSVNSLNVQHLSPSEVATVMERYNETNGVVLEVRRSYSNGNTTNMNESVIHNGHPVISVEPVSPTEISPMDSSNSSSPEVPNMPQVTRSSGARERREAMGLSKGLPQIDEGAPPGMQNGALQPPVNSNSHRHSLTPEAVRKPVEDIRKNMMRTCKSLDLANLPQWRVGGASHSVNVHNLLDDHEMTDRLYTKRINEYKETGCNESFCKGSHMQLKPKRPYATPRPAEEVLPLAEDFIKQYFESKKVALGHEYDNKLSVRLWQVKSEIETRGHYNLTYEELVFGARTAWRNAPRCVNRIVWRQLEVLDARDVTTAKEMFEAICHHIKYANNGGNLRSTITVFPNRTRQNGDFRVWNSQLVRYAGYKNPDGTILGDPANVEFTEMIMEYLGWTPPKERTEFDVLPLVLQANGGDPELFEIPQELVLEVAFTHPDYDWFRELGLRWYALPAVANMLLDCGGLEFPGIPFNGWYMGTEIARDLGDINRYNKLKVIAQRMGLNTQTYKLWKDRAIVELNVAVLHSFQRANFSIVDHHSTTESFITHMKSETQVRGGCPADWVWIVPPISGSVTPVFHQEMLLYHLSPSYEYQHDPWKYHIWSFKRERTGSFQGPHRFKRLAKLVGINALMYRKVYQKRIKATILFATETGRSRNYANVVKDVFGRVFAANACCMEEYDRSKLEHEQLLIIVTSTFGSGDPPANGESFGRYMLDLRNGSVAPPGVPAAPTPRSHRMSTIVAPTAAMLDNSKKSMDRPLTQVKYAVFGLGSRAYPNFCTFAHTCDNLLKDLGAEMILPCGEGDELCGQEESFQAWLQNCYLKACEVYSIDPEKTEGDLEGYKSGYSKEDYRIQSYLQPKEDQDICTRLKAVHSKNIQPFTIQSRTKLQSPSSDRSTILVVLSSVNKNVHYEPGDHIAIYPQNSAKLVNDLIDVLNLQTDPDKPIYVESRRVSHAKERWVEERRMPVPVTLREALTYYLDISNPPSPQFIKLLAKQASRSTEQEELNELAKGGDKYEDWKYDRFPNLCDVFNQFHSLKVDATLLLQQLPLLQCRFYSISSSPQMYPNEVHATVAIVSFKKRNGMGPWHNGVCSTWLNRVEIGSTIPCVIRQAHAFHLPEDPRAPIIMIGPGTGIAPYRSFWQHRWFIKNQALRLQLSQPSLMSPKKPSQPQLTSGDQDAGGRRRRKTAYVPPNLSLLQAPSENQDITDGPGNDESKQGGVPMRRSLSDTDQNEELAKVIASKQKNLGDMTLYFGCRRHDLDHIYKDELVKAKVFGALNDVHVAFSREPGKPKTYVQNLLKENADKIVRQLMEERGHVYVCGDISMAADVSRTLQSIFEENAAMSSEEARCLIESLKDRGFYHEDIFGVTLKHQEVTKRVRTAAKKNWRILVTAENSGHPLQSPMTPSLRMPSPAPIPRRFQGQTDPSNNYDTSTLPSSLRSGGRTHTKRPTVTVLVPSATTPPDGKAKSFDKKESSPSPKARKRGKTSLQTGMSINDSDMMSSGMRLLTIEEPQSTILEPLREVSESNLETPTPTDSKKTSFSTIPTIDIHSPTRSEGRRESRSRKLPITATMSPPVIGPPDTTSMSPQPATSPVAMPPTATPPVATPPTAITPMATPPEKCTSEDSQPSPPESEKPAARNSSEEKKKPRRIRTNSRVETVL